MSTILHTNPTNPQKRHIQRVVEALTEGKLVSYPTDTTYGIGCDLLNKRAIEKIYALKKRDRRKPVSILCSDLKELSQYARDIQFGLPVPPQTAARALHVHPSGNPPGSEGDVDTAEDGGSAYSGLSDRAGCGGGARPTLDQHERHLEDGAILNDPEEIEKRFRGKIDIVIAEACPGEPSSIIDLTGDEPVLIRRGLGDLSWLE